MVISSKKDAPEGWFSNKNISGDELNKNQSILFYNNKLDAVTYDTFKKIAANNTGSLSSFLDENEYKDKLELVKSILTNTDEKLISKNYKTNTLDNTLFCSYGDFFDKSENQDLLNCLYSTDGELGLLEQLGDDDIRNLEIVEDRKQNKSFLEIKNGSQHLLIVFLFNFNNNKTYGNELFNDGIQSMMTYITDQKEDYITDDNIYINNVMTVIRNYMKNKFNIGPDRNESYIKKNFGTEDIDYALKICDEIFCDNDFSLILKCNLI